ncbi:hypothetical protein [Neptunomonas japonica]|uniref:hypothetical protein n=1 Tax=Neptunomonas japonica TaxID=417574 RepID=UPI0012EC4A6E|nr:hypothetical protein [Neptunomonas japonica]
MSIIFLGPSDRIYDLYEVGINKNLRIIMLATMSSYIVFTGVNLTKYKFFFGRFVYLFIFIVLLYSVYSPSLNTSLVMLSKAMLWTLAAVCSYRLRLFGRLNNEFMFRLICVSIIIGCASSLYTKFFGDLRTSQNVGAYGLIWLVPLLFVSSSKSIFIRNIMITIVLISLLLILKRGAIISFSVGGALYLIVDYFSRNNIKEKLSYIISLFFLVLSLILFVYWFRETLYQRFFEDPTQRDIFYSILYQNWVTSELVNFVFGFGSLSVVSYTAYYFGTEGLVAHSDWLQLTHDYGLLGILLLLYFYFTIIYLLFASLKVDLYLAKIIAFSFGAMVCVNIYSGQFFTPNTFLFGLFVGIVSADIEKGRGEF